MKTCFISLLLIILFHYNAIGQEESLTFEKASFEKAKINGEDALKFFRQNIHYPYNPARDGYIDGGVFISIIIDKTGQIDSINILNEPNLGFEDEVMYALSKSLGSWMPTRFDGISLYKKYIAAFNFTSTNSFQFKKDKCYQYFKKGNMPKALKLINEALKIDPYDIASYQTRAAIYRKQKKYDLESLDLTKINELNNILLFDTWFSIY
jgi:tetratricopeptide (TPR) repeat protein